MFMKNIKTVFIATALLGAVSLCLAQAETKTTLTKLHQSYEKQGRRALGMPEYGKRVQFPAVVSSLRAARSALRWARRFSR
jgi:hypothetical protein